MAATLIMGRTDVPDVTCKGATDVGAMTAVADAGAALTIVGTDARRVLLRVALLEHVSAAYTAQP